MDTFGVNDWNGSYFELAIEFQKKLSNEVLSKCIHALWSNHLLVGPWDILAAYPLLLEKVWTGWIFVSQLEC
ncbi:hypothetical protein [Paenibacillus sp. YAF4_2]|uniref:hypothetical protein n=1 Tax=Paenibacillus sp. YAF4_2 TaxID=3233085 RepID=UPI003F9E67DA